MTFPYSHMSRDELISRAELEGDGLARALARALDEVIDEAEEFQADVKRAEEEREEAEDLAQAAEDRAARLALERDEAQERVVRMRNAVYKLVPATTTHKALVAIRDALNAG